MSEQEEIDWNAREPNRRRRVVRVLLIVAGAWTAVALVTVVLGALAIRDAQSHLNGVKAELHVANINKTDATHTRATAKALGRAHTMLGSPIVAPFKLVPIFGRQLRAVDAIAHAGNVAAEVGLDARERARPIIAAPPKDGPARLRAITTIREIARDGRERLEQVDFGPSNNLFSPIANTRAKFAVELNRVGELLQRADHGASGLAKFFKGPSRYAVFAANNAEMRAGSGMLLSGGLLEVDNGELKLGPMRGLSELPRPPKNVALEYDFLRLWGPQAPGSDYRFVNMTPRFPTSGALLQRLWEASGAPPVDGVLVIDPVAAAELVRVVGRVDVDGQVVNGDNATSLLLHDQYLQYGSEQSDKELRRDFLSEVVQHVFGKLNEGGLSATQLGTALGRAADGRHILAWAADSSVQRGWSAVQMDGVLPDQSVLFALQNRGANKLDYFQEVSATTKAAVGREGSVIDMEFRITNTVRPGEPFYIAGPRPGSIQKAPGVYVGIAAIDLPANASDVKLAGGDFDLVSGPDGNMQVVSQWVEIDPGETLRLRLTFSLPAGYRALSIEPSARVPEVTWGIGNRSWKDRTSQIITW